MKGPTYWDTIPPRTTDVPVNFTLEKMRHYASTDASRRLYEILFWQRSAMDYQDGWEESSTVLSAEVRGDGEDIAFKLDGNDLNFNEKDFDTMTTTSDSDDEEGGVPIESFSTLWTPAPYADEYAKEELSGAEAFHSSFWSNQVDNKTPSEVDEQYYADRSDHGHDDETESDFDDEYGDEEEEGKIAAEFFARCYIQQLRLQKAHTRLATSSMPDAVELDGTTCANISATRQKTDTLSLPCVEPGRKCLTDYVRETVHDHEGKPDGYVYRNHASIWDDYVYTGDDLGYDLMTR